MLVVVVVVVVALAHLVDGLRGPLLAELLRRARAPLRRRSGVPGGIGLAAVALRRVAAAGLEVVGRDELLAPPELARDGLGRPRARGLLVRELLRESHLPVEGRAHARVLDLLLGALPRLGGDAALELRGVAREFRARLGLLLLDAVERALDLRRLAAVEQRPLPRLALQGPRVLDLPERRHGRALRARGAVRAPPHRVLDGLRAGVAAPLGPPRVLLHEVQVEVVVLARPQQLLVRLGVDGRVVVLDLLHLGARPAEALDGRLPRRRGRLGGGGGLGGHGRVSARRRAAARRRRRWWR